MKNYQEETPITKCILEKGIESEMSQPIDGDIYEIGIKLLFDKKVLKTDHFSSDSLIGISNLCMDKSSRCYIKIAYYNTQIMHILHQAIKKMYLQELAHISFEFDPDLLNENFKETESNKKESKVYLDLKFEINLIKKIEEIDETIKIEGTCMKSEDYLKIDETVIYKINEFDLLGLCVLHKTDANDLFKKGFILTAFKRYHKSISLLIIAQQQTNFNLQLAKEDKLELPEDYQSFLNELSLIKSQLYSNLAACQLKSKKYKMAIINCTKCLELNKINVKALFRRGQCFGHLNEFEKARIDFEAACLLSPDDIEIKKIFNWLQGLEKNFALSQKQYGLNLQKMFK